MAVRLAEEVSVEFQRRRPRTAGGPVALNDVPPDALAIKLGSNRNALYKMMFDARRKLRAALVANGYLHDEQACPRPWSLR
jgi:RNA polymerase sigma-70 factor, ECF subfamily